MKTITPVSIWANGKTTEAKILNAYAVNVILNTSATFYYGLFAENEDNTCGQLLQQGNISMSGADYQTYYRWHCLGFYSHRIKFNNYGGICATCNIK